jgi:hypothetical protein
MQHVKSELKKLEKKLKYGDARKIAKLSKINYNNVITALRGNAGDELSALVLMAGKDVISARRRKLQGIENAREMVQRKRLKKLS